MRTTRTTAYLGVLRLLATKELYDLAVTAGIDRPFNYERAELVRQLGARTEMRTHAAEAIKARLLAPDVEPEAPALSQAAE